MFVFPRRLAFVVAAILTLTSQGGYATAGDATETGTATAIAAGGYQGCAITPHQRLKCWGDNQYGQLGVGKTPSWSAVPLLVPGLENVTKVDVGDYGVCAILEGGKLKCWGRNDDGEVGDGTTDPHSTPTQVKGLTSGVRQVSVGTNHVCALLANGKAKCWGNNDFGELGDRSHDEQHQPALVQGIDDASSISAGYYFTCATVNSKAKCWGYNEYGEVGNGSDDSTKKPSLVVGLADGVKNVVAGYYQACAILTGGQLKCWGLNGYGEVGNGTTGGEFHRPQDVVGLANGVTDVDPDYEFTCAIHIGRAKCWGNNYYGQIGNDGNNDRDVATQVTGLTQNVVDVDTGWYHACALLKSGAEKCWGYNGYGQIGNDDLVHTAIRTPMRVLL